MLTNVLSEYNIDYDRCLISSIGNGLINHTWKISFQNKEFILQRVNNDVFKNPKDIDSNINLLSDYFHHKFPEYAFVSPIRTVKGETLIYINNYGYYRLYPFVKNSYTHIVTKNIKQAYEAAKQFGKFTRLSAGFPQEKLKVVIADFHNLSLRCVSLQESIKNANINRLHKAEAVIDYLLKHTEITAVYEQLLQNNEFKIRVTHYDTKISNILFNIHDEGLCVIDLDTVMPGYFISDFGDMIRTYISPVSEEEVNVNKIEFREDYFKAIVGGYLSEMKDELSKAELEHIVYSGKFMLYMQAVRFLTDYLNNDIYYTTHYETHNLVRAINQITLLEILLKKENILNNIVKELLKKCSAISCRSY
ncbi:MAG: phosphotransferase [Arachidicoccus sp.]|nr:phosphotransferase [Arachidicoccus sp.]